MTTKPFTPFKGQCTCGTVTYEVLEPFLCINCCHCTWCQRETGTAFALNGIVESSNFRVTSDTKPTLISAPSASGKGQKFARCPTCYVVLYSHYGGIDRWATFVRTGTLDAEGKKKTAKPDVHIYTSSKLAWLDLTSEKERGVTVHDAYYDPKKVWTKDALERFAVLKQKMEEAKVADEAKPVEEAQKALEDSKI